MYLQLPKMHFHRCKLDNTFTAHSCQKGYAASIMKLSPFSQENVVSKFFSVAAPTLWNSIPENLKSVDTIITFHRHLKSYLSSLLSTTWNSKQLTLPRVKGKVYKVAVRPAMLYGLETVALTKRQEAEMEVAELKMLRFSLGVTRMDKIRNEYIRGTAQVGKFGEKTREARLRWYGHLRRKDDGYIGRRMLRIELPGKRKRGRPKRRFMDVVKEDMAEVEVTEEDTVDRNNWRRKIRCGDP